MGLKIKRVTYKKRKIYFYVDWDIRYMTYTING